MIKNNKWQKTFPSYVIEATKKKKQSLLMSYDFYFHFHFDCNVTFTASSWCSCWFDDSLFSQRFQYQWLIKISQCHQICPPNVKKKLMSNDRGWSTIGDWCNIIFYIHKQDLDILQMPAFGIGLGCKSAYLDPCIQNLKWNRKCPQENRRMSNRSLTNEWILDLLLIFSFVHLVDCRCLSILFTFTNE